MCVCVCVRVCAHACMNVCMYVHMHIYISTHHHPHNPHPMAQILLDNGALINAEDGEGNTPLHVKCYGETDKPSEMECLELLLAREAVPTKRNNRVRAWW